LVKITVGGVVTGPEPVVKPQVKFWARVLPARSSTPATAGGPGIAAMAVSVYEVLAAKGLVGVKVAVFPDPAYATDPGTSVVRDAVGASVKVLLVMVEGSIGLLKTAETVVFVATSGALQAGVVEITVGGVVSEPVDVVKLHEKALAIAPPCRSLTPVVTQTVMRVPGGRVVPAGVGVMVAVLLAAAYTTAPGMGVVPGPVR